jgi:hypothetical protein
LPKNQRWWATKSRQSCTEGTMESGPKTAPKTRRNSNPIGRRVADRVPALPQRAHQLAEVQDEIAESHNRSEMMQRTRHAGAADQVEDAPWPIPV